MKKEKLQVQQGHMISDFELSFINHNHNIAATHMMLVLTQMESAGHGGLGGAGWRRVGSLASETSVWYILYFIFLFFSTTLFTRTTTMMMNGSTPSSHTLKAHLRLESAGV